MTEKGWLSCCRLPFYHCATCAANMFAFKQHVCSQQHGRAPPCCGEAVCCHANDCISSSMHQSSERGCLCCCSSLFTKKSQRKCAVIHSQTRNVHSSVVLPHHAVLRRELHEHRPWQWEEKGCLYSMLLSGQGVLMQSCSIGAIRRRHFSCTFLSWCLNKDSLLLGQ